MKECVKFECINKTKSGCTTFGDHTDCTLRRCYQSCKMCKHYCKNRKGEMNRKVKDD